MICSYCKGPFTELMPDGLCRHCHDIAAWKTAPPPAPAEGRETVRKAHDEAFPAPALESGPILSQYVLKGGDASCDQVTRTLPNIAGSAAPEVQSSGERAEVCPKCGLSDFRDRIDVYMGTLTITETELRKLQDSIEVAKRDAAEWRRVYDDALVRWTKCADAIRAELAQVKRERDAEKATRLMLTGQLQASRELLAASEAQRVKMAEELAELKGKN